MIKLFKKKIRIGDTYSVTTGDYVGQMFVYMESTSDQHSFLCLPEMTNRNVPKNKFELAIADGILEYIERLPKYVRKTTAAKFQENKNRLRSTT